jgi:enoyl-CoA hydratase/carnithine racemase
MTDEILFTIADHIGVITLNRPDQKNAFTVEMVDAWSRIVREAATDDSVRVLVVTGAGDAFCAGADTKKMAADADDEAKRAAGRAPIASRRYLDEHIHQVAYALERFDKPVIAAVNGAAIGAGMDMALMCDLRIAGRSARFAEAYMRAGLVPGNGGCYFLPRLVGLPRALELLLTGDFIDGEEAARIGLVNRVVDDSDVLADAMVLAARLAASPPIAIQLTKRAVYESLHLDLRTSLDLIASHTAVVRATEDSLEALASFREKRPAEYKGF